MRGRKLLVRGLLGCSALFLLLFGVALSQSKIELTEHGVHKRLLLPIGPGADVGIHLYGGTGDDPAIPGFLDGPVVRADASGNWSATWYCEDRAESRTGAGPLLVIECGGKQASYPLTQAAIPPSVFAMPAKLAVISDIEGNRDYLDATLRQLGVADANGNWTYGANHLVIAGDSVDRGREVFPVLWRLHALSLQAQQHGGAVHVLLGNHEQYILRGNTTRAHKEHLYALEQMGGYAAAFGADTVLGKWLRAQPVILKAGTVLLTHGGISPEVGAAGLSVEQLNTAMQRYWLGDTAQSPALDAVIGPAGLTQYRGYFEAGGDRYAMASTAEVQQALRGFGASAVVVGHTIVERVSTLHDGRVLAVDVNSDSARPEVLVFDNGIATVVNTGIGRNLNEGKERRLVRPIELGGGRDWGVLRTFARRTIELARLPNPY